MASGELGQKRSGPSATSGRRARRPYDVVFYAPWVGSILTRGDSLPPGGAETQVLSIARVLAGRGVRVAIIAYGLPEDLPSSVDGVRIVPRPPYRKRGRLVGKLLEMCIIWRSLWHAPSTFIVRRGAGIDLGLLCVYAMIARRRLIFSTANVVDFDFAKLLPKRQGLLIYELGARLAYGIVVQTEEQVPLCERTFRRRPAVIKSIATPDELQSAAPEAFLWVGRLVAYKRPLEYLALARALPQSRFWMVGVPTPHGEQGRRLVDTVVAEAQQLSNLELLPPCPHEELRALMSRAVASVNTAKFEGMPNVLLEAWAMGVPALVLTHDPGGVVTAYGLGGFASGSHEAFVELGGALWDGRNDRGDLAERCRAYVADCHGPASVGERWLEILSGEQVTGERHASSRTELTCAG